MKRVLKFKVVKRNYCTMGFISLCIFFFLSPQKLFSLPLSESTPMNLPLKTAIELTLKQNRSLSRSMNAVEGAKLSVDNAMAAFDYKLIPNTEAQIMDSDPNFGVGVTLKKKWTMGFSLSASPSITKGGDGYWGNMAFGLSIPLLRGWGKETNLSNVYMARFVDRNAERSLFKERVNSVLRTVSLVYNIVQLKSLVLSYDGQVKRMRLYLKKLKHKKQIGMATPLDVFRAEILLKDTEDNLSVSLDSLSNNEKELKKNLALDPRQTIHVSAPLSYPPIDVGMEEAVAMALANRVEIEQEEDLLVEVRRKSKIAKQDLLSDLMLEAVYQKRSDPDDVKSAFDLKDESWSVRLTSSTDWARTSERIEYRRSLIEIENVKLNIETLKDEIASEVVQKITSLEKTLARIGIREKQLHQAQGKLQLSKMKYKNGMADNFNMIESEREIQLAESNLLVVQKEYIVGLYELRASMGSLLDR